jgi:hypothetical protein
MNRQGVTSEVLAHAYFIDEYYIVVFSNSWALL